MSFKAKLESGKFVVTVELCPPKGIDVQPMIEQAEALRHVVDAINLTDNQRAVMRMSSVIAAHHVQKLGITPICQLTCRDRNRLALQSDLLGAASLGIENVLILTGDHTLVGNYPEAKPGFDLDSVQLLATATTLKKGRSLAGNELQGSPELFLGGVVNPARETATAQCWKLERKVEAGLKFVQTQAIYDIEELIEFMEMTRNLPVYFLAGIIPLKSARMAHFMNANIPGINVPDKYVKIMEKSTQPVLDGLYITAEVIDRIREARVCHGIHIMPMGLTKSFIPWAEDTFRR